MIEIKCSCGNPECKIAVWVEKYHGCCALWFRDKEGKDNVMYLDVNSLISLIKSLRDVLVEIINEEVLIK